VPQALNRYAETAVGQPGVYQAAASSWNPFTNDYTSNIGKSLVSDEIGNAVEQGVRAYFRASFHTIAGEPIMGKVATSAVKSQIAEKAILAAGTGGLLARDLMPGSLQRLGRNLFDKAVEQNTRIAVEEVVIGSYFSYGHRLPAGRVAGKILSSKLGLHVLDAGVGLGIDVGYQLWLDSGNPYLDSTQQLKRAFLGQGIGSLFSFGVGKGASSLVGTAIAGPVGFVVGVGVSIAWDIWIAPRIYERLGAVPSRQLAPLNQ